MIRRPPRSTLLTHSFPTRRSSDLAVDFKAEDCILVQDDIHLPLGKLRSRARGSDGGHKGVRSALVAFQTDSFRRLKIGVEHRSEEHTSEPQSLMRISYAVFCLKKKKTKIKKSNINMKTELL